MLRVTAFLGLFITACGQVGYVNITHPSPSDDQRRIWVVHNGELLRCADGAANTEPVVSDNSGG